MVRFMMFPLGLEDSTMSYSLFRTRQILAEPPINSISLVMNFVQRAESEPEMQTDGTRRCFDEGEPLGFPEEEVALRSDRGQTGTMHFRACEETSAVVISRHASPSTH